MPMPNPQDAVSAALSAAVASLRGYNRNQAASSPSGLDVSPSAATAPPDASSAAAAGTTSTAWPFSGGTIPPSSFPVTAADGPRSSRVLPDAQAQLTVLPVAQAQPTQATTTVVPWSMLPAVIGDSAASQVAAALQGTPAVAAQGGAASDATTPGTAAPASSTIATAPSAAQTSARYTAATATGAAAPGGVGSSSAPKVQGAEGGQDAGSAGRGQQGRPPPFINMLAKKRLPP